MVRWAYMAHGEGDTRERASSGETHTHTNPVSSVCQQVTRKGNFRYEQKENDHLKHCWGNVQQIEGVNQ